MVKDYHTTEKGFSVGKTGLQVVFWLTAAGLSFMQGLGSAARRNRMGQPTLGTRQEPDYTKADYYDESLPSIEDIAVFLADARELLSSLDHFQKEYPVFYFRDVTLVAEMLVTHLEDAIRCLEE